MTVLAFGVISQAILNPQADLKWALIESVVKQPYFQMYGELFLESYEGNVNKVRQRDLVRLFSSMFMVSPHDTTTLNV